MPAEEQGDQPNQDEKGQWLPGNTASPGRQIGSVNKFTRTKEAMLEAMEQAKIDGKVGGLLKYLINLAESEPVQFLRCVTSILPKESKLDVTQRSVDEYGQILAAMPEDELRRLARATKTE